MSLRAQGLESGGLVSRLILGITEVFYGCRQYGLRYSYEEPPGVASSLV